MLNAIIVEDEVPAAERLRILLEECDIQVLEKFRHAEKALEWLSFHQVDLIFVDIGLPEMDGLSFVKQLKYSTKRFPFVIFTTAHEEHALQAFELAAVDYLLKPIKVSRLKNTLARIQSFNRIEEDESDTEFNTFSVTYRDKIIQIRWQQVAYLQAEQKIVFLYTYDKRVFELPKTLIYWEELLNNRALRIHRNALIMRHALHSVELENEDDDTRWVARINHLDTLLPISRRQLAMLRRELKK